MARSGFNTCVRTGEWTPAKALPECETMVAEKSVATRPITMAASLSSDGLFAYGKANLEPQGIYGLDAFVVQLKGKQVQKITVIGHTDRLGSAAGNRTLSEKRAAAVKNFLVSKGVNQNVIQTSGVGSAQPKTTAVQCNGVAQGASLIACLAPDRRVDIQVSYR